MKSKWLLSILCLGLAMASMAGAKTQDDERQAQVAAARAAESERKFDAAMRLWLPLAREGLAEAQYFVGLHYVRGEVCCESRPQGFEWLLKSAAQGYTPAERTVGRAYLLGIGVTADYAQAVVWLQKAAEKGDAEAQYWLGQTFRAALKDYPKAAYWYQKSADQGYLYAFPEMGHLNYLGRGLPQDYAKAAYWYGKGAEKGDGGSQYAYASLYENGYGVPQDFVQAYKWYVLATTSGQLLITVDGKIVSSGSGAESLVRLESKMTPAQIEDAKRLITEARSVFPFRGPPAIPGPTGG